MPVLGKDIVLTNLIEYAMLKPYSSNIKRMGIL